MGGQAGSRNPDYRPLIYRGAYPPGLYFFLV
jgi:hypothetical protein